MAGTILFSDITLVTPQAGGGFLVLPAAYVTVSSGRIESVFNSAALAKAALAGRRYTSYVGRDRILWPALANSHNHMAMTLLRNSADDLALQRWLFEVIFPKEERLDEKIVAAGSRLALAEMIRAGIGASADMYFFADATARAALETGFRLNLALEAKKDGPDPDLARQVKAYRDQELLEPSLLVHSIYLYEENDYRQLAETALELDLPVQVHVAETKQEIDDCLAKYGRRPAAQLAHFGLFKTRTIAAHCVHLDDAERQILAENKVFVAHCPASNLKLGSGIADLAALLNAGVPVALGTDGPASNNNLDLLRDLRLAALLAKGINHDPSLLPAETILTMATAQGMAALGFAGGYIEAGRPADLQIIRTDRPGLTPLGEPAAALAYSAAASDVESLMVNGRWLLYKGELQTLDEEKVIQEARQAAAALA